MRIVNRLVDQICKEFNPSFNFQKYVKSKPGGSRRRFLKAYSQMLSGQTNIQKNSGITAFVKNERYFEEGKSPRMIMGRDPKFNIIYARFIARLESAFFALPQVANACDYAKCGEKFANLFARSKHMFENDMSKYEASQRSFLLALEFLVYDGVISRCAPADREDLVTVFAAKCIKPVSTGCGVKASFEWCRGSGDLDTSIGNGVINYITTMYFMCINSCEKKSGCKVDGTCCKSFEEFVLKGDDSYGCAYNNKLINTYSYFGLDAKLIFREDAMDTEFCSGNFVRVGGGKFYYVQKLRKLITSVSTIINLDIIKNGWVGHYIKSLGLMYKVLYKNIPIYEDFADMLVNINNKNGLNINLIENISYGTFEAFSNPSNATVDSVPETLFDISSNNEMSYAELDALRATFNNTRIVLPDALNNRCCRKSKVNEPDLGLSELISNWVNKAELSKSANGIRRMLTRCRHHPLDVLKQLAAENCV